MTYYARLCIACCKSPKQRLERNIYREPMSGCWLWTGATKGAEYGFCPLSIDGSVERLAHRVSWILYHGPITAGLKVLHRCDVPLCVNPAHLFLGTQADNHRDMVAKKRHAWGSRNRHAKLSGEEALQIKAMDFGKWGSKIAFARERGINVCTVKDIISGRRWKNLPEPPK